MHLVARRRPSASWRLNPQARRTATRYDHVFSLQPLFIWHLKQSLCPLRRQQFPNRTPIFHTFDAPNTSCEIRIEKNTVGRLIRKPSDGAKAQIDSSWSQMVRLQMNTVSEHDGLVERQSRFRAIPLDKFVPRAVFPFGVGRTETVQDRGLSLVEIR